MQQKTIKVTLPYQTRGTRTDTIQIKAPNNFNNTQKTVTAIEPFDPVAQAKYQAQYNACKKFVQEAQKGAYDGRWSQGAAGQLFGVQRIINANKAAEQCPPELLNTRPASEWLK